MIESLNNLNNTVEKTIEKCPWTQEQKPLDITKCVKEELYEVIEEIKNNNNNNLEEEVGDLMFTVILLGKVLENQGKISFQKSIERINEKIIKRSPHVFGNEIANTSKEALEIWNKIKFQSNKEK